LDIAVDGFRERGGTERQIVAIASGMVARGWITRVVVRYVIDPHGEHAAELRDAGVELILNPKYQQRRPVRSRGLALAGRLGVDLGYRSERDAYGWLSQQLRNGAVVHEIPFFGRIPPAGRLVYASNPVPLVHTILGTPADAVHPAAPWAAVTSDGDPRLSDPRDAITWIPSVGPAQTNVLPRARGTEIALLFVGRLVRSKGLDLLLMALRDASPRFEIYPDVVDGVEEEGGVPSRLIQDRYAGCSRQEGTPWKMFARSPLGRLMKDASASMTSLGRARVG
jgi:hypothetical protein